ncbi:MAG: hypothetical protein ACREE7_15550 [Dongiaceae bacterium]
MYGWLRTRFSKRTADVLIVLWYAFLMVIVLLYAMEPPAVFRYGNI